MQYKKHTHIAIFLSLALFLFSGCSEDEPQLRSGEERIAIPLELTADTGFCLSRSFTDNSHTVNRILILPFKKNNETATNEDSNFLPEYTAAKQFDIHSFPAYANNLNLSAGSSYKIMVLGYSQNAFDYSNQAKAGTLFAINSAGSPANLNTLQLTPASATVVPEFFSCICQAYLNDSQTGTVFLPQSGITLKGSLARLVSGLSLKIQNIPAYVDSISIVADQLVTSIKAKDATPTLWQTSGDAGIKTLKTLIPANGTIQSNTLLLPTLDARKTKLYLWVYYRTFMEQYTVNVADMAGVSSANSFTFKPNQVISITGDYSKINFGFLINGVINLDDNAWDGLQ